MSLREQQLVSVAGIISFAQCASGSGQAPDSALADARRYLSAEADANNWLFGYWDAKYLAKQGMGVNDTRTPPLTDADDETTNRCVNESEYLKLQIISAGNGPGDEALDGIVNWSGESWDRTVGDVRVIKLIKRVDACIKKGGQRLDHSDIGGVKVGNSWSAKQMLKAFLVEAKCRDDMNFTKRVASIDAVIQSEYIKAHPDDLTKTRQVADERVARANEILREVGLI